MGNNCCTNRPEGVRPNTLSMRRMSESDNDLDKHKINLAGGQMDMMEELQILWAKKQKVSLFNTHFSRLRTKRSEKLASQRRSSIQSHLRRQQAAKARGESHILQVMVFSMTQTALTYRGTS